MAKLFANLDILKNAPRPNIVLPDGSINQGGSTLARTSFASVISLSDRLKQSKLGTTRHLPEFFLSDLFTGVITIKKYEPFQHTSNIKVVYPSATVDQGSATIKLIRFLPTQGGTNPTFVTLNSLNLQGTIFSNGVYTSVTTIIYPIGVGKIQQGSVVIKLPINVVNQGTGTNPTYSIGLDKVKLRQGLSWNGLIYYSSVIPNTPLANYITIPTIVINTPNANYLTIPTLILGRPDANYLTFPTIVIPEFINSDPNIRVKTQGLKTLRYTADRSLALFTPQIKHGSEEPQNQINNDATKNSFKPTGAGKRIIDLLGGRYGVNATAPVQDYLTETKDNKNVPDAESRIITNVLGDRNVSNDIVNNLLKTVQIGSKVINIVPKKESNVTYKTYGDVSSYSDLIKKIVSRTARPENSKYNGKEVKVSFARYGGSTVTFTAFLTSLSDSVNTSYGDVNYVGKQDTFKVYKGTTRQIGIGFKAVALGSDSGFATSDQKARALADKVNKLIQTTVVGKVGGKAYTEGPFIKFSLTGLYSNLSAIVNSVKIDVSTTETPWDAKEVLPMYYDISLDLTILSTQEGTLFDSNKTFIG
jgi:hypothetical protein